MSDKKQLIISETWAYLLRVGLAKASVGSLCKEAQLSQSSLYYWFENKDDIWVAAGKYGLSEVVGTLMDFTFNHIDDPRGYFDTLLDEAEKYKHELRLALQITTSPIYGDRMRDTSRGFRTWYDVYAQRMVSVVHCSYDQAERFIYSIIAFVVDFAIWDDRDKTQMLLENLYKRVMNALEMEPQQ